MNAAATRIEKTVTTATASQRASLFISSYDISTQEKQRKIPLEEVLVVVVLEVEVSSTFDDYPFLEFES